MIGEIIAIGNELTSGRIHNTTSGFAARHLFEAGYDIHAMHTIGDSPLLIGEALQRALRHVDFIIVTGGLGATDDDLTNEAVSKALNRPTLPNFEILSLIRDKLVELSSKESSRLEKLAWLPEGANPLNPGAKMSGYMLVHDEKPIFFLPGVPSQMQKLLVEDVMPQLATWPSGKKLSTMQKLFKIFNLTEVEVNQRISSLDLPDNVQIGYYPVFPEVHLSLTVRDHSPERLEESFQYSSELIREALSPAVFGYDRESMELVVGRLLKKAGMQLATAESCTGGLISHKLTTIPGSSSYFLGGVTSYANSLKMSLLNVAEADLINYGAVSEQVARTMADSIKKITGAEIGVSVTGIAGPDGGSAAKPVGTVFIGLATPEDTTIHEYHFSGDRHQIQEITTQTALDLIRSYLLVNKFDSLH